MTDTNGTKGNAAVRRLTLLAVVVVAARVAWPSLRTFLAHNTRTQVHRINR